MAAYGENFMSAVMTFLFTDIEGPTCRWEKDADLMRKACYSAARCSNSVEVAVNSCTGRLAVWPATQEGMTGRLYSESITVSSDR
jgi:hypothetical protein